MKDVAAVLRFRPDGTGSCLYTEALDLASLGRLRIRRASRVEFDNDSQLWRVWDRDGGELYSSPSRTDCLRWERDWFDAATDEQ